MLRSVTTIQLLFEQSLYILRDAVAFKHTPANAPTRSALGRAIEAAEDA